ncbi:metallophosphoesterase family protein [Streptomyces sp. NBC_01016]|uniref:purple acid phosphatase family protein n=1 Tax=Streptomyces sp. NBC_01016 TaxID=2903720 RepID=UPI0022574E56|nr:metallophosphoesterase family protein [Streptomyces sp. NBC_01016]MCX4832395.1 metallophosphoesterase family protein [Streptomyces sp. NBC_01016]
MDIPRMGVPAELADRPLAEQHEYLRSRFSRRTMIRGGAVTLGAVAGGVFVPGAASASPRTATAATASAPAAEAVDGALVAPFGRHLSYGDDARTEMTVSWQVPVAVKDPFIRVGAGAGELSRKIPAELKALYTPAGVGTSADHTQYYVHAKLTRLKPGKTYYYGVGHRGFDPASPRFAGTIGTFTTAPARSERFTFTAFGDQGVSYHALANDSLILAQGPAFHLHAGDIAYADPSGQGKTTDTFDARTWDQFLAQTETVAKSVPWMVSYGNHDMEAWYSPNGYGSQEARFAPPGNGPDPKELPGVYSFVHGNTAVISLDANDVSYEIPANLGISGGTQTAWFERQLKKFRAAGSGVDFVVVFFHHCAYCTATAHASEGGVRKEWVPLFEKYTVDLVINGHNHVYERTDVLKGDKVTKELPIGGTAYPETDGVVYVTAGAAGKGLYEFPVEDTYEGHEKQVDPFASYVTQDGGGKKAVTVDWSRVRYTNYSFLRVDVEPAPVGRTAKLTVRGLAETGAEVDRFVVARKVRH